MLKKIGTYVGYALLWILIITVVVLAERLTSQNQRERLVAETNIEIEGGGSNPMINTDAISHWLKEHNAHPEGHTLEKLDIANIESVVESHHAVDHANVSVSYDGKVDIDIKQREPIARMRIAGYDMYITKDGYLLPAQNVASVHVPVITGDYKPLFNNRFIGYAKDIKQDTIAAFDSNIQLLEDEKLPHYKRLIENNRTLRIVRRSAPKKSFLDSEEEYKILSKVHQERLSQAMEQHSQNARDIKADIAKLEREQERMRQMKQSIEVQYDDFVALMRFIEHIQSDSFWSAEVVQIIASGGGEKPLQIAIIPRSGHFTVDLGTMDNINTKLKTLYRFYTKGLSNVGWDKYRSISLRYEGQVVCR